MSMVFELLLALCLMPLQLVFWLLIHAWWCIYAVLSVVFMFMIATNYGRAHGFAPVIIVWAIKIVMLYVGVFYGSPWLRVAGDAK